MPLPCEIMRVEYDFDSRIQELRFDYDQLSTSKRLEHRVRIAQDRAWLRINHPESPCLKEDTSDVL
jgi:hypothetical protein